MPEIYDKSYFENFLSYDHDKSLFFWSVNRGRVKIGYPAGTVNHKGYLIININGKLWQSHRLVWLFLNGNFPERHIDHINGNKLDNSINNLRVVDDKENNRNRKKPKNNTSGITGVYFHKCYGKYVAFISGITGDQEYLGSFDTLLDAAAKRLSTERRYGYHVNHGR